MPLCFHKWSTLKRWMSQGSYHLIQRCRRCNTFIRKDLPMADSEALNVKTRQYKDDEKFAVKAIIKAEETEQRVLIEQGMERRARVAETMGTSETSVELVKPQPEPEKKVDDVENYGQTA